MASDARASGSGSGPATQLEFTQAMSDFKVMFPTMDADVIEAVLRANNGAVDATIDHLLAMSADNDEDPAHSNMDTPPGYPPHGNPPSYQQAVQKEGDLIHLGDNDDDTDLDFGKMNLKENEKPFDLLSDMGAAGGGFSAKPSSPKHAYSHPKRQEAEQSLGDFSPPNRSRGRSDSSSQSLVPTQQMIQDRYEENLRLREEARTHPEMGNTQMLEDERLALMMQNEEFLAELRHDREFLSTLADEDDEFDSSRPPSQPAKKYHGYPSNSGLKKSLMMDEAIFREKLKTMGKSSKKKFTQLAHVFSRRKGAKQLLGHAPAPSNDDLLLNAEPLVNREFDSDEEYEKESPKSTKKTPTKGKYTSFS